MNCYRCATPLPDNVRYCYSCGADVSGETNGRTQPVERDSELEAKLREEVKNEFIIERVLGRGGMAVVFLATDAHLGRRVAIKVLPPELTYGTGMVERFKREARTAATLDHPHIVPIHRISTGGKLFWYVMKYIEGESLADVLERERVLSFTRSSELLKQVADALWYAHQQNVVHRDIKPANVMVDLKGSVVVTDFGIAKAIGGQSLTGSGAALGTPYYMSPEQCSGGKEITPAADQYSLGVMVYQMVTGQLPFTGESAVEIIKQHCFNPPPPPALLRPEITPALAGVVERAIAKSAEQRFDTVVEFAAAFANAAEGVTKPRPAVVGRPKPMAGRLSPHETPPPHVGPQREAGPVPKPVQTTTHAPSPVPPARRRSRAVWSVATVVALAGGFLAVLWARGQNGAGETALQPTSQTPVQGDRDTTLVSAVQRDNSTARLPVAPASRDTGTQHARDTGGSQPPPARSAPRNARLYLSRVPSGARITVDGRTITDSAPSLRPGVRHIVTVSASGFETWADTVVANEGEQFARIVQLQPKAAPTPSPLVRADSAFLSVASQPVATIFINGQRMPGYRVIDLKVPADSVHIRFEVSDSAGPWSVDTIIQLTVGEHRNLGRLRLTRKP